MAHCGDHDGVRAVGEQGCQEDGPTSHTVFSTPAPNRLAVSGLPEKISAKSRSATGVSEVASRHELFGCHCFMRASRPALTCSAVRWAPLSIVALIPSRNALSFV